MSIKPPPLNYSAPKTIPDGPSVFIVEADRGVRLVMRLGLRSAGYATLESADGDEAIRRAKYVGRIQLVIADLAAVRQGDFLCRLAAVQPGVRVLFVSDQAREDILRRGWLEPSEPLLVKPFRLRDLVQRVAEFIGDDPVS